MKYNILILSILCVTLNSCIDFLDVSPSSDWKVDEYYKTKAEVDIALAGIYGTLAHDELYGQTFNVLLEAGTDESYTNDNAASWSDARYEYSPSDDPILNAWARFYTCINLINLFEAKLQPELLPKSDYCNSLAKARFYRAFCYFNLANWWGAVPLRLTYTVDQESNNVPSSSVLDVYTQIEKDLKYATAHLLHAKNAAYIMGEPNKMAAHGLLARLYLRMGGYQPYLSENEEECFFPNKELYFVKAKAHCDTIIYQDAWHGMVTYERDSLSYRNHFINYLQDRYDTKESLFEISFGNLQAQGISVSGRLGNTNGVEFVGMMNIPRGFCKINASVALYNLYMEDEDDKRLEYNIAGYKNNFVNTLNDFRMTYIMAKPLDAEYGPGKFRRWEPKDIQTLKKAANGQIVAAPYEILNNTSSATDPNFTSINFPILRYADVLLMYAEAAIGGRQGTIEADQKALECLNAVRNRAGLTDFTNTGHDIFFNELVDERLRELCFEGLRKQDLIRWNLLEDKLKEAAKAIMLHPAYKEGNTYHTTFLLPTRNFDKKKHLQLPYPLQEVEINKYLIQKYQYQ